MRVVLWVGALVTALGCLTAVGHAQEQAPAAMQEGTSPLIRAIPAGQQGPVRLALTRKDAIVRAMLQSPDIDISREDVAIAFAGIHQAWGEFEPFAFGGATFQKNRQASFSREITPGSGVTISGLPAGVQVNPSEVLAYNAGLRWKSPIGLSVEARYDMLRRTSASSFALDPSYTPAVSVTVRQALTRGFGLDVNQAFITVARIGHEASLSGFHDAVLRLAERVEDTYWGVAFAEENLKVARQALVTSEELLRNTQARREADVVADLDVFSAETAVASRQEQVLRASNDLENAQDGLLRLILPPRDLEAWNVKLVLADTPRVEASDGTANVGRSIETAFENRPDLRSAALALEIEDVQIDRAKNDALPRVDLVGGWTQNGLGGTHHDSHSKLSGGRFYDLSVGFEVEVPILNLGPNARRDEAEARRRRALRQRHSLEQTVVFEVRAAARDLESARERIRASGIAAELAEKQLQAEQDRLSEGLSTSFDVLQKEEDLTTARTVLIGSRIDYVRARMRLRRAEGTLLTAYDIELE